MDLTELRQRERDESVIIVGLDFRFSLGLGKEEEKCRVVGPGRPCSWKPARGGSFPNRDDATRVKVSRRPLSWHVETATA